MIINQSELHFLEITTIQLGDVSLKSSSRVLYNRSLIFNNHFALYYFTLFYYHIISHYFIIIIFCIIMLITTTIELKS